MHMGCQFTARKGATGVDKNKQYQLDTLTVVSSLLWLLESSSQKEAGLSYTVTPVQLTCLVDLEKAHDCASIYKS